MESRHDVGIRTRTLRLVTKMVAPVASRFPFLLPAMGCLVAGVLTGLFRAGGYVPFHVPENIGSHSIFLISGFFGTVIGLERAVASRRYWSFFAPALSGAAGLTLLSGYSEMAAAWIFCLAALCFVATSALVFSRQPAAHGATLLVAALLWLSGNLLWLINGELWASIPFGLSFLVLTIAGERLELTRFLPPRKWARALFFSIATILIIGTASSGLSGFSENTWLGLAYAALALWLIAYDIATKTISQRGITRFVAVCLLTGYGWLLCGGLFLSGLFDLGVFQRDAGIHAVALGFIFAMVIGHAPIIFPAVFRTPIPYSPIFYLPLALLELGVGLRFVAALLSDQELRAYGADINALAIFVFILTLLTQSLRGSLSHRKESV